MTIKENSRLSTMYPPKAAPFFLRNNLNSFILNDDSQKNQRNLPIKAPKTRVIDVLVEFCKKSTFHGIPYLVDRKRHWIERMWWLIAFLLSMSLCITAIYSIISKWRESLIVLESMHKLLPIGEVPFPSITICPLTKFSTKKFNYTDVYRSMLKLNGNQSAVTDEDLQNMKVASQICDEFTARDIFNSFNDNYSDSTIRATFSNLAPRFNDTMEYCQFSDILGCSELFYPIITEEGLCYTFNSFNANDMITDEAEPDTFDINAKRPPPTDWKSEKGYDQAAKEPYPYRVYGTGPHSSLFVIMRLYDYDLDYMCAGAINGFKLTFQSPHEQPQLWKNYYYISPGRAAMFKVSPNLVGTSPSLSGYNPRQNCEIECLVNFTKAECDCVKFSMPMSKGDEICGPAKMDCCIKANAKLYRSGLSECNCLSACNTLQYDIEVTQADFHFAEYIKTSKLQTFLKYENSTFSRLVISFRDEHHIPQERRESNNLIDILAESGGIFGLFMGASLLSFVELIYYLTIRLFFVRRQERNSARVTTINQTKGTPNSMSDDKFFSTNTIYLR